jgi:hypothetical protein
MLNRPRFQFGLGTLLTVVTLCALAMAVISTLGPKIILGCAGLVYSFALVLVLALLLIPLDPVVSRLRDGALFVFTSILLYGLAFAFCLFDATINQPHPEYVLNSQVTDAWLIRAVMGSALSALLTATLMLLPVAYHFESRKGGPRDWAYYPRLVNVWRGLRLPRVRLILIIGGLLVFGYYAETVITVQSSRRAHGLVWPAPPVMIACHLLWGLLWLADGASRPQRGMAKVAIGYLCIAIVLLLLFGLVAQRA